jgi:cell division protein FtsL
MSANKKEFVPHTLQESPWRNQTQLVAALAMVVVILVIIGALYLIQSTTTTTTARELDEMSRRRDQLASRNEQLRAEIAELQSLPNVMTRAAEMNFRSADGDEIQYIIVEGYRYHRPQHTPTPFAAPTTAAPAYDETLGGWFHRQWDALKQQFEEWRSE